MESSVHREVQALFGGGDCENLFWKQNKASLSYPTKKRLEAVTTWI